MDTGAIIAFMAACFAGAAVFVSVTQQRTIEYKLKLDLYDKRFAVYTVALEFFQVTLGDDLDVGKSKSVEFVKYFRESQFLFEKKDGVYDTLRLIQIDCSHILEYRRQKQMNTNTLERDEGALKRLYNLQEGSYSQLLEYMEELERQIEPYLDFRRIQSNGFDSG